MSFLRQIRRFSTSPLTGHWVDLVKAPFSREELALKSAEIVKQAYHLDPKANSHLIHDIIQRQVEENPTSTGLVISKSNADKQTQEAYSFREIIENGSRLGRWLKSKQLRMINGNQVLVLLSPDIANYSFLQLACLKSNLIFQTMKKTDFNEENLRKKLRVDSIDCIISDIDHLDLINKVTYCNLRPLKKVLISESITDGVTPFGWVSFNGEESSTETDSQKEERKTIYEHLYPHLFIAHQLHARGRSRFVWIKDDKNQVALSSWLLGSTAFYQNTTSNEKELRETLEKFPIDTFCGSKSDFQLLTNSHDSMKNQLTQLIATERIDDESLREKWRSSTNLEIHDDFNRFPENFFCLPSWLSQLD